MNTLTRDSEIGPPLIGVSGCRKVVEGQEFDSAAHRYIAAIEQACQAVPLIVPTLGDRLDRKALLSRLDGLLFTGSLSNVEPHHYDGPESDEDTLHDPYRDATTLPLMAEAVAAGIPVFCICRGFQELNVVFGGTLHQKLQEIPGKLDHRSNPDVSFDDKFAPVHDIDLIANGILAKLAGTDTTRVNSLHGQGIDTLGQGLRIEATAPDGVIEGISAPAEKAFTLAVQWHPEWQVMENPFYLSLFTAFAEACRDRLKTTRQKA